MLGCAGSCQGTATVNVPTTGGPFGILWTTTPPQTTPTISGLCAGSYGVAVLDVGTGCIAADTQSVSEIPGPIITLVPTSNSNCNGVCSGGITAIVTGATGPYTYVWDNGITDTDSIVTGICGGLYSVTVTDATGCSSVASVVVNDVPSLNVSVDNVVDATCPNSNDGEIQISANGGAAPLSFDWSGPSFSSNLEDIDNLLPGAYNLTITDASGCLFDTTINVGSLSGLAIAPTDTAVCDAVDSITFYANATGITNPSYNWVPVNGGPSVGVGSSLTVPFVLGDTLRYIVFVTDNGCVVSDTAVARSGQVPDVDAGPTQTIVKGEVVKIGGSPTIPFAVQSITWSPSTGLDDDSADNPNASPATTTFYTVTVVDLIGCEGQDTVTVIVNDEFEFASGFSPNDDGVNDTWKLDFLERYPDSKVEIYNRWGQLVFSSDNGYTDPWDGTYEGSKLPIGTYYYIIDLGNDDVSKPLTGPITILR